MNIVLNEYEWAEQMIENHSLGKKPTDTLRSVSKYYLKNGYSKNEIRELLDNFMLQCDPGINLSRWADTLDKIAKNADKLPLVFMDGVDITDKELVHIDELKGRQIRRLAFVLLCAAKYCDNVFDQNNHWVNCEDREVMQMANISTSIKRQCAMFAELHKAGLLHFSRKIDALNVQILFVEEGTPILHIQDFRNLGFQYLKYCGEPYFECENCGLTVKANTTKGRRQKYCPACAMEVHTRQKIDSAMRCRDKK